jgi:hypothetical protein
MPIVSMKLKKKVMYSILQKKTKRADIGSRKHIIGTYKTEYKVPKSLKMIYIRRL